MKLQSAARPSAFSAQVRIQRICMTLSIISMHRDKAAKKKKPNTQVLACCPEWPKALGTRPPPSASISPIMEPATAVASGTS